MSGRARAYNAAVYGMEAYNFHNSYRTTRKNHYGRGASFGTAVGYSVPAAAASHLTRHMPLKYSIPASIGADIAGQYATNKLRKRYAKQSYRKKRSKSRK